MAALLAGVASYDIGQGGYLLEGPEDSALDEAPAGVAASHQVGPPEPQLA
jgi:hypothetical protein